MARDDGLLSRRGVSPVITSVLVVLVAVSLVSAYTLWIRGAVSEVESGSQEEIERSTSQAFSDFRLEGTSGQDVTLRNTGSSDLTADALDVFINGRPIEHTSDFSVLRPDEVGTLTLKGLWKVGPGSHEMTLSAGSFSDSTNIALDPARGVVGSWRFEEGDGTTALDFSGGRNPGSLEDVDTSDCSSDHCPEWVRDTPLKNSEFALSFDGSEYVSISDEYLFEESDSFTIEFWFNRRTRSDADLMGNGGFVANSWNVGFDGSDTAFFNLTGDADPLTGAISPVMAKTSQSFGLNEWHHLTAVYEDATGRMTLYVNGEEIAGASYGDTGDFDNGNNINLGKDTTDNSRILDGLLDEVRLYKRARHPDELYWLRNI